MASRDVFLTGASGDPAPLRPAVVEAPHAMIAATPRPFGRVRDEALSVASAAQVVVASSGELAGSNRRADALLGLTARDVGRQLEDLEVSSRPLRLRTYIERATRERRTVWALDVDWQRPGVAPVSLDVQVVPLVGADSQPLGTTVIFTDVTRHHRLQDALHEANRALGDELQHANGQLEAAYDELRATNEELETTNEELRSTNEELGTMNEELRSMNDELEASSEELRVRTLELSQLHHVVAAVLTSLGAAVAVVDRSLSVLAWNAGAAELWGVREDDAVGRPLGELAIGLPIAPLRRLVRAQLVDDGSTTGSERLPAVDRRGSQVEVDVTVSALRADRHAAGAILVMSVAG